MEGARSEETLRLLAKRRNRAILSHLNDAARPLEVTEIAERLVAQNPATEPPTETALKKVSLSLHHNHLPKLANADLITYDANANVATYQNYGAADAGWTGVDMIDELSARFRNGAPGEETVGTIEGRESVIARGQQLFEEADEELFLLFVSDELLADGRITRLQDAIERGVDVYLGSQTQKVRDLVRRRVPEATVWEPQQDWLSVSSQHPRIGRFVFADRQALMLALLDEPESDGNYTETALTGEGETNPLVLLARELLGPRLDHLDYQSEDLHSQDPFNRD